MSHHTGGPGTVTAHHLRLSLLGPKPLHNGKLPHSTPCTHHTQSQTRFPHQLGTGFPIVESQASGSLEQFNHGTVTEQQLKLGASEEVTRTLGSLGFCVLPVPAHDDWSVFSVQLPGWCHRGPCALYCAKVGTMLGTPSTSPQPAAHTAAAH